MIEEMPASLFCKRWKSLKYWPLLKKESQRENESWDKSLGIIIYFFITRSFLLSLKRTKRLRVLISFVYLQNFYVCNQ
jgi:hypothetical protein